MQVYICSVVSRVTLPARLVAQELQQPKIISNAFHRDHHFWSHKRQQQQQRQERQPKQPRKHQSTSNTHFSSRSSSPQITTTKRQQQRLFSSSSSSPPSSKRSNNNNNNLTLRRLARPFISTFHPDRQATTSTTTIARDANLKAIQTLNGMIDTVDYLYTRAIDPNAAPTIPGVRVDLEPTYTIEFLIPSSSDDNGASPLKPREAPVSTRRSVDLTFTTEERNSIRMYGEDGSAKSMEVAVALKIKAMMEVSKLLRVAGLKVPHDLGDELEGLLTEYNNNNDDEQAFREGLLFDELALNDDDNNNNNPRTRTFSQRASSPTKPKTPYEESRHRFLKKFRTNAQPKLRKMYEEVIEDNKRDLATRGLIQMSDERKQRMVADIISRIRVHDGAEAEAEAEARVSPEIYEETDNGLTAIGQLIAIRRMSLLLNDNFESLKMEEMGRLWENTCIVLTEQRLDHLDPDFGKPFSRRIRLKRGKESGFKFSYHSDGGRCTVYIPVDFTDDEILGEFDRHLSDFYDLCVAKDGFEDFFPSYYKDFKGHPRIQ